MSLFADESSIGAGLLAAPGCAVENREAAALLDRLADLLEIEGANPFRVREGAWACVPGGLVDLLESSDG